MQRFRALQVVLVAAATAALLLVGTSAVSGKGKDVSGTKHYVATPGVAPCTVCHIPRNPEGEMLWSGLPNSGGLYGGMRPLCFSCHDGTVTAVGAYVFNPDTPTHMSNPGLKGEDCDRCHDPHESGYGKFVKYPRGANMCQNCHTRAGPSDHPINVSATAAGIHPSDRDFDPYRNDFSGTRLWNLEGTGPGDYVKCMTCHAPHGGAPNTALNTIAFTASHTSFLPLCANCHFKWGSQGQPAQGEGGSTR